MTRRAILGLALFLATIMDTSGQSKPEPPRQNSASAEQRTDAEQYGTDQAPPSIIIKQTSPEHTQPEPTANRQNGPDKQGEAWGLSDKIAVAASVFALLQFFALIGTICIMTGTAKRQLRAYIGVSVKRAPELNVGTVPRMILSYKNFGQTPAREVRYWVNMIIEQHPSAPRFELRPFTQERLTINPGELEHIDIWADHILTQNEFDEVRNDAARIYTYGEFCYFDVFGKFQSTPFRLMYGGQRMIQIQAMARCAEGNSST